MTDSLEFFYAPTCGPDPGLSGCLAAQTAPCVSVDASAGGTGTYFDRNGDPWSLTSISIQAAPGQASIGPPIADGTLYATAIAADGRVLHLVFAFQVPFRSVLC
jgi:hypothetical protein